MPKLSEKTNYFSKCIINKKDTNLSKDKVLCIFFTN